MMYISEHFTPIESTIGGLFIGLSAALFLSSTGRIAGISGMIGGSIAPKKGDILWRLLFLASMAAGSFLPALFLPSVASVITSYEVPRPLYISAIAGLFVGFGTRMGSGCTSGHGVCGLARRSMRSLAAVCTFMATGVFAASLSAMLF